MKKKIYFCFFLFMFTFGICLINFLNNSTQEFLKHIHWRYLQGNESSLIIDEEELYAEELKGIDPKELEKSYKTHCINIESESNFKTSDDMSEAYQRFSFFYQKDADLIAEIKAYLIVQDKRNIDLSEVLGSLLKLIAPFIILVILSFVGWFTCCSCCCYDYCPIICKRNNNLPYRTSSKLMPVILVIFSGFSLIIPAIMSYINFGNATTSFKKLYCTAIIAEYTLYNGTSLDNNSIHWLGYNKTYFEKLGSLDWLKIDESNNFDQIEEFERLYKTLMMDFDNLYYKIQNSTYTRIINPTITNRNKNDKVEPLMITNFGTPNDDQNKLLPFVKSYISWIYTYIKTVLESMRELYNYLKGKPENLKKLFEKMNARFKSVISLIVITKYFEEVFRNILFGSITTGIVIMQTFVLVFQIFVSSLNIISSLMIILNYKSTLGKYLSHSSWCLSSMNLVILTFVVTIIYTMGIFMINIAETLNSYTNSTVIDIENTNLVYLKCLSSYNETEIYTHYTDSELAKKLDNFTDHMLKIKILDSADSFKIIQIMNFIKKNGDTLADPTTSVINSAVGPNDEDYYPVKSLEKKLNRIVDFRHSLPYQVMNDCGLPTSIEMFLQASDCTYPVYDNPEKLTWEDIKASRICIISTSVTKETLQNLFKVHLDNCEYGQEGKKKYLDDGYDTVFDELIGAHDIITSFNQEFEQFRNFFASEILIESASKYYDFSKFGKKLISNIVEKVVNPMNKYFDFRLEKLTISYTDPQYKIPNILTQTLMTLNRHISCNIINPIIEKQINYTKYVLLDSIFILIVCYTFNMLYNIISSVFGLMANLINYANDDEENLLDKKNN